jgi:hypothetical protein
MKRKEGAFIVAQAAIVIAVLAALALPLNSVGAPQSSSSSTTQTGGQLVLVSPVSPQGLQLKVALNPSSIQSRGAIRASVEVLNTLDRNVSLSGLVQNKNISDWNGDDYLCAANGPTFFVGFALFQGHFAAGNISAGGQPLQLAPPMIVYCGSYPPPGAVTFLPQGDQAVATNDLPGPYPVTVSVNATTGYCTGGELAGGSGRFDCGYNPGLVGYWNDSIPSQGDLNFTSPAFVYFSPGEYTIVAADDCNQYLYATFVVS